jgi:hypothetical protein
MSTRKFAYIYNEGPILIASSKREAVEFFGCDKSEVRLMGPDETVEITIDPGVPFQIVTVTDLCRVLPLGQHIPEN